MCREFITKCEVLEDEAQLAEDCQKVDISEKEQKNSSRVQLPQMETEEVKETYQQLTDSESEMVQAVWTEIWASRKDEGKTKSREADRLKTVPTSNHKKALKMLMQMRGMRASTLAGYHLSHLSSKKRLKSAASLTNYLQRFLPKCNETWVKKKRVCFALVKLFPLLIFITGSTERFSRQKRMWAHLISHSTYANKFVQGPKCITPQWIINA
jgi:hypothetical protein